MTGWRTKAYDGYLITICENARAYPVICASCSRSGLPARCICIVVAFFLHVIKLLVLQRDLCNADSASSSTFSRQPTSPRIRCANESAYGILGHLGKIGSRNAFRNRYNFAEFRFRCCEKMRIFIDMFISDNRIYQSYVTLEHTFTLRVKLEQKRI